MGFQLILPGCVSCRGAVVVVVVIAGTSDVTDGSTVTVVWAVTSPVGGSGAAVEGAESPCVVIDVLGCGDEGSAAVRSESVRISS